ncbi:hypothetical protein B0H16DRAFT_1366665 [Mycena metata]|uniref:Cyclin N-terminal domain-containing protein n=1 Tax=Mycena metata TaxID=1033252 RepID=A0AAD7JKR4_9AGAR|nr:hypothetical protein B0H16DRAFT_1366665 [Mycena metata]
MSSPASTSSSSGSPSSSNWSSPSSSVRSSPVHAASLVDPAIHSPALMQLIDIKLDRHVIDYVVECVADTVDYAMGRTHARGRSPYTHKFTTFVQTVLSRAEVTAATVLTTLVYVARARPHLSVALEEWALERVFLGALIVASKYTNDSTLKNVHWALCTGVFGKGDVGRIEREFLDVLDWELGVSEDDLLAHHEGLLVASSRRSSAPASRVVLKSAPLRAAHVHHVRRPSVPELEPSSPQSSLASMSPRTPASRHATDVPMDVDATYPTGKKNGTLHDLVHAFSHPRAHSHSRNFAIQVHA